MGRFLGSGVPWLVLIVVAIALACAWVVRRGGGDDADDLRYGGEPGRARPHADLVRQAREEASAGGLVGDLARAYVQRRVQQLSEAQSRSTP